MKSIIYFYCFYHIQTISTCFKYKIKVYFYHSVAYSIGHIIQVGVGGGRGGGLPVLLSVGPHMHMGGGGGACTCV